MAAYSVEIKRSAIRELERVEPRAQRRRLVARIRALALDPRPATSVKLAGKTELLRIRQGDHRILYEIDDAGRRIVIIKIGHRRDVYR